MLDERLFDSLVSDFYQAATGAIGWNEALSGVQQAFNARTAVLQSIDPTTGAIAQLSHGGPPMHEAFLDYYRHWHAIDPRRAQLVAYAKELMGRWWHCNEHFDEDFASRDRFYRHFLPSQQTRYCAASMHMTSSLVTGFALELPANRGPLTADERYWADRLGRHFGEALQAYERVRRMAMQALASHDLLDAFSYPMWLLDADRFIFHANAAAQRVIAVGVLAGSSANRLRWATPKADRQLGEHLLALTAAGRHRQRWIVDARQNRSDRPSWLHLHALSPMRVLGAFGERPLMLVTWFDPSLMTELDPFALGDLFGMTPTEARIAGLLAEGLSAPDIGARLGSTTATVRTHLRRVLAKLGANRLADAVRLLRQGEALWALPQGAGR